MKSKGITVKVSLKKDCLQLMFEATQVPPQKPLVQWIEKFITKLDSTAIKKVKIYGRKIEDDFPEWQQEFELPIKAEIKDETSNAIVEAESPELKQHSTQQSSFFNSLFGSVTNIAEKVGNTAIQASQTVTKVTVNATDTVNQVATQTYQIVTNTANSTSQTVLQITNNAGKTISYAATQTTDKVGSVMDLVNHSPLLKSLTTALKVELNKIFNLPQP